jgi:hypothetical protein
MKTRNIVFIDSRVADYTQGQLLAAVAMLALNQQHINLVGLQATGVEYV